ncbi:MAG: PEP-CTERM sorting domain-containing protein [Pyrinomonadaceae bacterium]
MLALSQSSCIVAGGYRSNGGWYIWPGSIFSLLVVIVVFFLLRRRRR